MRYKQSTIQKLEAQGAKLETLKRSIEMTAISGPEAIKLLDTIIRDIKLLVDRIELEPNE